MSIIESSSLFEGWVTAFEMLLDEGVNVVVPLIVSMSLKSDSTEVPKELDMALLENGCYSCNTTANTIFPNSYWNRDVERTKLYERYMKMIPVLKRADRNNRLGIYFERLINYSLEERGGSFNQLEFIIRTYQRKNYRRSALQASVFNPFKDLTHNKQRGFPCLQHVFFTPDIRNQTLMITGVYATQHIFDRAYGNYLGLHRLGEFMAHEMGLTLNKVICIVSQAKLGHKITKTQARVLLKKL